MFKKIHSNRDPRDTLYSEIRREFGSYFVAAGSWLKRIVERNPRVTFFGMISLMAISITVSILFFRYKPVHIVSASKVRPGVIEDGFDQIFNTGSKIKRALELKHLVDSLSSKQVLTARDSVALDSALNSLQTIQKTIK